MSLVYLAQFYAQCIAASYRPHRSLSCATTRPGDPSRSSTGKAVMKLISHNYEITGDATGKIECSVCRGMFCIVSS
jgi:hypothetical protein